MASIVYLVGKYANILNGAESVAGSSEDSLYPAANLYDELPAKPFKFNAAGADDTIDVDANRLLNGDFEDWTAGAAGELPDNWEDNAQDPAYDTDREGTIVDEGTYSLRIEAAGTDGYAIQQDFTVLSGWAMTATGKAYSTAGGKAADIRIQNLHTGKWLDANGDWQSTTDYVVRDDTADTNWTSDTVTFSVEPYSTTGRHTCTLRVICWWEGNGAVTYGYFDGVAVWPHVNFASIHGHNLDAGALITPKLQSDDNSSYSSVALLKTMTVIRPAFYSKLGSLCTERYYRLLLDGAHHEAGEIGQLVLGQYDTLARSISATSDPTMDHAQPQSRSTMPNRQIYARKLSDQKQREWSFDYVARTTAQREEILELAERCNHGVDPIVFVPFDDESAVLYGYLTDLSVAERRKAGKQDTWWYRLGISESPFAISVA